MSQVADTELLIDLTEAGARREGAGAEERQGANSVTPARTHSRAHRKSGQNDAFTGEQVAQQLGQAQHGVQRRYRAEANPNFYRQISGKIPP